MDLVGSMPPTSVACESSFSHMKLIKTARRERLTEDSLDDLLTVKLQSPKIKEFSPDEAIDLWLVRTSKSK